MNSKLIKTGLSSFIMAIALSQPVSAYDDDKKQSSKQFRNLDKGKTMMLVGLGRNDRVTIEKAASEIAAAEAYLAVLDTPAFDNRLVGHLYDEETAKLGIMAFASKLFHHELKNKTGWQPNLFNLFK